MENRKNIFNYMVPGIIGLLFNSLYIIVDGIFVSKMLGSLALASVTLVVPIVEFIIALSLMISIGGGFYISYYKGKKDTESSRRYFNQAFSGMFLLSITITVVLLLFVNPIVTLLGASKDIYAMTKEYYIYFTVFIPFFMLNYALSTWIRNDGKPKLTMITQILGAVINIILDYVFMGPLQMGIKGAAIATGLGPVIGILILLPHFLIKSGDLYFERVKLSLTKFKQILQAGLPSFMIEFSLGVTTFFCNLFIINIYAEAGVATFGVIGYINLVVLSIFLGMGQGVQPIISRLEGQGKEKEISDISKMLFRFSIIVGIIFYGILFVYKANILPLFIDVNETVVYNLSLEAINMFFITLAITGVNITAASIFESKNKVLPSVIISILRSTVFLLPTLMMMSKISSGIYIWLAVPLTEILTLFVTLHLKEKHINVQAT